MNYNNQRRMNRDVNWILIHAQAFITLQCIWVLNFTKFLAFKANSWRFLGLYKSIIHFTYFNMLFIHFCNIVLFFYPIHWPWTLLWCHSHRQKHILSMRKTRNEEEMITCSGNNACFNRKKGLSFSVIVSFLTFASF